MIDLNSFTNRGPGSQRPPFRRETTVYQAAFEALAPEVLVITSASIFTRAIAASRLTETAKPALAHLLANSQLHLRVWLALIKHL